MDKVILTTPEELRAIISEAVSGVMPKHVAQSQIDTLSLNDTLDLLQEHGYPTSRAKMYKLTSSGAIPCKTYGKKLVFSRKEVLAWAEKQTKSKRDFSEVSLTFIRNTKHKK